MDYKNDYDLTKEEERAMAISHLEDSFTSTLFSIGIELCPTVTCRVLDRRIELGIAEYDEDKILKGYKTAFASTIDLYANEDDIFGKRDNHINFGSSGAFDNTVKESYWRTIHAAEILKRWDDVSKIVNEHCKQYAELSKQIQEANK